MTIFLIYLSFKESLNINVQSIHFLETAQSAGGHLPLILLDDVRRSLRSPSLLRESPLHSVLFSLTLSPAHSFSFLTSLFDSFYNQSAHSWFCETVEPNHPSCLSIFFSSCRALQIRENALVTIRYFWHE